MRQRLRDEIDQRKYKVGQAVQYYAPRGIYVPRGAYYVTAELPFRAGEFEYRIKHPDENYERVAVESALTRDPLCYISTAAVPVARNCCSAGQTG